MAWLHIEEWKVQLIQKVTQITNSTKKEINHHLIHQVAALHLVVAHKDHLAKEAGKTNTSNLTNTKNKIKIIHPTDKIGNLVIRTKGGMIIGEIIPKIFILSINPKKIIEMEDKVIIRINSDQKNSTLKMKNSKAKSMLKINIFLKKRITNQIKITMNQVAKVDYNKANFRKDRALNTKKNILRAKVIIIKEPMKKIEFK
jgi:hypothetical protein